MSDNAEQILEQILNMASNSEEAKADFKLLISVLEDVNYFGQATGTPPSPPELLGVNSDALQAFLFYMEATYQALTKAHPHLGDDKKVRLLLVAGMGIGHNLYAVRNAQRDA